jgi:hypothetical protein
MACDMQLVTHRIRVDWYALTDLEPQMVFPLLLLITPIT